MQFNFDMKCCYVCKIEIHQSSLMSYIFGTYLHMNIVTQYVELWTYYYTFDKNHDYQNFVL
jgi:hypothetical protein